MSIFHMVARIKISYNYLASHLSARRVSILLTIIALALWSYSITQAKLNIGFYGLIHSFPITFFIALGLLTLASAVLWVSRDKHDGLLFFHVSLLILSLWLVPLLIGGSQPVEEHVREKFAENVYPIIESGGLDYNSIWYHNWPATWILGTSMNDVLGPSCRDILITLAPFILQFLFLLPLYMFLKNTFDKNENNYYWVGIWIFLLANWLEQNYFGPQALGFFFFLMILALFSKRIVSGNSTGNYSLCIIIILACLTVTHLLSSLVALIVISLLYFVSRKAINFNIVALMAVFIAAWMIYQTTLFFESNLPHYLERAFRLDLTIFIDIFGGIYGTRGLAGSESHQAVAMVRMVISIIFTFITLAGITLIRLSRRSTSGDKTALIIGAGILLSGVSGLYGMELTQRIFYFILPVVSYFSIVLIMRKPPRVVLCLVLLAALPLHFISHYGNEIADHYSPAHDSGRLFLEQAQTDTAYPFIRLGYPYTSDEAVISVENNLLVYGTSFPGYTPHYFYVGQKTIAEYAFFGKNKDFVPEVWSAVDGSEKYNLIYLNPEFSLYSHESGG